MDKRDLLDVCRNRHLGNPQSVVANPSMGRKRRDKAWVFEIIGSSKGVTSKEIALRMGRRLNCISGRISELKKEGLVRVDGTRDGCGILKPLAMVGGKHQSLVVNMNR